MKEKIVSQKKVKNELSGLNGNRFIFFIRPLCVHDLLADLPLEDMVPKSALVMARLVSTEDTTVIV